MKRKLLLNTLIAFMLVGSAWAQRTITGTVTSADGSLPGATVQVKGTNTGTTTDIEGKYSLVVPEGNDELTFRFVGYVTKEETIGSRAVIDVFLDVNKMLDEVVVAAVGIEVNKRELGYSIQNVDADNIVKSREVNLVNALSGQAAGVQVTSSAGTPGGASQIRIRGNTTVVGDNSPLFVIDGIPIDNSANNTGDVFEGGGVTNSNRAIDINPNDIASMTVLKGPAATALYGSRGANGVIVITTKRGAEGKAKIQYSSSLIFDEVNKLPGLQTQFAQGRVRNGVPTYRGPETLEGFSWGPDASNLRYSSVASPWYPDGKIVPATDPTATGRPINMVNNTENFFVIGQTFNNSLSISGGNDKINYFTSIGNLTQTGIIPNTDFKRTSLRATISSKITDKFKTTFSANYVNSGGKKVQQGSNTSGIMLGLARTTPSFDNGAGYELADGSPRAYRGLNGGAAVYDNPYWTANKNFQEDNVNRLIGFAQADYQVMKGLNVMYRLGIDTYSEERKFRNEVLSATIAGGQVLDQTINSTDINSDFIITYEKDLTDKLSLKALVGHNYYSSNVHLFSVNGQGLAFPGFFNLASASTIVASEVRRPRELFGAYVDARLSYGDEFFVNFTGRNDWSSTLSNDNNSFFYPTVSAGWSFTETFGLDKNDIIPYGKLRASYGQVGSSAPFGYTVNGYVQTAAIDGWTSPNGILFPAFGVNAFNPGNSLGNRDLVAERTTTLEVGADLRLFKGKATLDITYYRAITDDIIVLGELPPSSGFAARAFNAGTIRNEGIELVLGVNILKKGDFTYDLGVNFTTYKNVVDKLPEGLPTIVLDPFGSQRVVEGYSYGTFFGTRFLRDENGNKVISPTTGMPLEDATEGVVGDPIPDFTVGLNNQFAYKNISLSFLLDIRSGGDVYNGSKGVLNNFGVGIETLDRNDVVVFEGVLADGDGNPTTTPNTKEVVKGGTAGGANYYQNYGFTGLTELNVEDGSWIRLRQLNISYNLPSSMLSKAKISAASIGFTARNLFLITKFTGIDPETNLTGAVSNVIGYDYFNNPNTKSYGVSLNLTF
jgi:TonB-linked SusC/RagA family outer membrane protein